jgi:hypothetical protein
MAVRNNAIGQNLFEAAEWTVLCRLIGNEVTATWSLFRRVARSPKE